MPSTRRKFWSNHLLDIAIEGATDRGMGIVRNPYPERTRPYDHASWQYGWDFSHRLLQMRLDDLRREGGNDDGQPAPRQ